MNPKDILTELLVEEMKNTFQNYSGYFYLDNAQVAKILRTTPDNLRKRIKKGMYIGLYEDKGGGRNEIRLWNKFKFFAWYFGEQIELLNIA